MSELQSFFDRYGKSLASGDLDGVADAYGYPSLVLGGPETVLVSSPDDVRGAFAGAAERYRAEGFTEAVATIDSVDDAATGVIWASVRWTYQSDDGSKREHDAYRYLLRTGDDGLHIVALATVPVE